MRTDTTPRLAQGLGANASPAASGGPRIGGRPDPARAGVPGPGEPRREFRIAVARGLPAVSAATPPARLEEWRLLADGSPQVAVYQGPAFVLNWYEVYEPDYEPLLLFGIAPDETLVGVLPLAIRRDDTRELVFAGAEHCEYAGWLAIAGLGGDFPARCVAHLHEQRWFGSPWDWKWLAPGTPLDWLDHPALRARGIVGRVREATTPVLHLQDPDRPRFFSPRKKNFKRKMNLLKGLGEVRLARLAGVDVEGPLFERLMTLYDIRQLSRYGVAPFAEDPLKGVFHRRLIQRAPEAARCFALMAGRHAVAFNFDIVDARRAIYCMAPFDLAWLGASPGKLITDLVADQLAGQNFDCFDYSPGGDEYKEEAASAHETVHRLELLPSRLRAQVQDIASALRDVLKQLALKVGVTREHAQRIRQIAARAASEPALAVFRNMVGALKDRLWSRKTLVIYRFDRDAWRERYPTAHPDPMFRRDALEDFLAYAGSMRWLSRRRLLELAIGRLRDGEQCYTVVEDGALVHFAWLQPDARTVHLTEVDHVLAIPPKTAMAYGVFTDPRARGRGLHKRSFQHRLHEAFGQGAEAVVTAIEETNTVSLHNAEMVGFRRVARITRIRRFGRVRWIEDGLPLSGEGASARGGEPA